MNEDQYGRLYPDLVEKGGLLSALRNLLTRNPAVEVNAFGTGKNYAHIQYGERSAQIFIGAEERRFDFDLWQQGKVLADGTHTDLQKVVKVIEDWVASTKGAEDFEHESGFVKARSNHSKSNPKPGAYLVSGDTLKKI